MEVLKEETEGEDHHIKIIIEEVDIIEVGTAEGVLLMVNYILIY